VSPLRPAAAVVAVGGAVLTRTWLTVRRAERVASGTPADAIVVFGARALPDRPSRELQARLDHAVALWRAGRAPVILCSGGVDGEISEAHVMARSLRAAGVPDAAIELDAGGACTRSTVTAALAHGGGRWERVIAVSSPFHMRRIGLEARRQGLACVLSPAPGTPQMRRTRTRHRQRAREVAAIWWYAATGLTRRGASATARARSDGRDPRRTHGTRTSPRSPAATRTRRSARTPTARPDRRSSRVS
jgi:vancomycin permeability regulator SanA